MAPASAQVRVRPERKDGGHPALCNAPPQWLRMRHQSHQSHLLNNTERERIPIPPQCLRTRHQSQQSHQYPCTAKAVASIAHCSAAGGVDKGWVDTSEEELRMFGMKTRTTPTSTTSILIDRMLQVCCRCSLLCMDLRMIRSPPTLLVARRGFPIKTITN